MPQIKDYNAKTTPDGTDEFVFQETAAGETKKITHTNMVSTIQDQIDDIIANPVSPSNYIDGLEISNNVTDSDHDIDIATGVARDSSNSVDLVLSSSFTKQIDATWAAGTNSGGLFSGASLTADTWYYVFLIEKDSDDSIDAGFDDNKTATNIPTGYTEYRRIGAVLTDGSSNILAFIQKDNYFYWDVLKNDFNSANPGTSAVLSTVSVPPDMIGIFNVGIYNGEASLSYYLITSPDITDSNPSTYFDGYVWNASVASWKEKNIKVNSSSQIRYRVSLSTANVTIYIKTIGFIDSRK